MVEVQGITKLYGSKKVLDNLSFTVGDQEILGFLGPNGAGKSTAMNIIAGYTSASAGTVKINGYDMLEDPLRAKKQLGYLPEHPPLYPDMTVGAYLSFMFDLKKIRLPKKAHLAELGSLAGISDVQNRLIKNLSKGYQQRVGLAQALLGNPGTLILDEPTVGLDPQQIQEVRNLIQNLGKHCGVIFSSHILQEIQGVCQRILVIHQGRLLGEKNLSQENRPLLIRVEGPLDQVYPLIRSLPRIRQIEYRGPVEPAVFEYILEAEPGEDPRRDLCRLLGNHDFPLLEMRPLGISVESLFFTIINNEGFGESGLPDRGAGVKPPMGLMGVSSSEELVIRSGVTRKNGGI